jgi:hypothetical protein
MTTTAVAPKIVGKALYLEMIGDPNMDEDTRRKILGWQHNGTKQLIIFPEYQDDTGKVWGAVVMSRVITTTSPRAQWESTYVDRYRVKPTDNSTSDYGYVSYQSHTKAEWDSLTEREKFDSRKLAMNLLLKNNLISTTYGEPDETGARQTIAKQAWAVRDSKPISVEITDSDMDELHRHTRTPQAVIRRINKVRDTLDKFPEKLA